jgi:hypothetical protein
MFAKLNGEAAQERLVYVDCRAACVMLMRRVTEKRVKRIAG